MGLTRITSDGITDGTVVNADINASAAIDVSKLSGVLPLAGGTLTGTLTISNAAPNLLFTDSDHNPDFGILASSGQFRIQDTTNTANLMTLDSSKIQAVVNLDALAGLDVTGAITGTGDVTITKASDTAKLSLVSTGGSGQQFDIRSINSNGRFAIGTASNNHVLFESSNNNVLIADNAGNVGIGLTNPSEKLEVSGDIQVTSGSIKVTGATPGVRFTDTAATGGFGHVGVNNSSGSLVLRSDDGNALSGTFMGFEVDGSETARITTTDLLIGKTVTTTSTTGCRVTTTGGLNATGASTSTNFGTSGGANITLCNNNATNNNFTTIGGYKSDGLVTSQINFVNVNHSSRHGALAFMCHNGSSLGQKMLINKDGKIELGASGPSSQIDPTNNGELYIEADPGNNYGSSNIRFHVDNGEIMRIVRGTNPFVAIGRTTQQGNEGFTVDRNGQDVCFFTQNSSGTLVTLKLLNKRATSSTEGEQISFLDTSGNQRGKIINNTSTTTYITSSDYRLKENQVEISDGIDRVKQLKPYKFNWKNRPGIIVDGFFAHEVENLVKDCVSGTKDRVVTQDDHDKGDYLDKNIDDPLYQMIDNSQIVPLLTAALKETITKIETLETKVAALEAK